MTAVSVEHTGTFNRCEGADQWKPFTSTQRLIIHRPGFDWDGRITMIPGRSVRVHDAYVAGEGILHAAVLGLVPIADLRGTGAVAQGEVMRFLAESAWYPTALLQSSENRTPVRLTSGVKRQSGITAGLETRNLGFFGRKTTKKPNKKILWRRALGGTLRPRTVRG